MRHGNLVRLIRPAAVTVLLVCAAAWAAAQNPPTLRYNFQAGRQYAYEVKIQADLEDVEEIREGVLTYNVLSATDQQIQLKQSGRLAVQKKPRPGRVIVPGRPPRPFGPPMMGGFPRGGPRFGPAGPVGTTIDRQGKVIVSQELTPLPFLLGEAELLVIEELPTGVKLTWDKQRDVRVEEKQSAGPFGPPRGQTTSERGAKERSDYAMADRGPDLFRISKKYQLRTGAEGGGPGRFDMSGAGELQFDPKEGVFKSGSMKYTIRINEPNLTLTVPVTVVYRLLTPAELAERQKREADAQAAAAAAIAKANAPTPFAPGERARLLKDLRSKDQGRLKAAADRLQKAEADERASDFAKALAPLLSHPDFWVQGAAAKAMTVWATPDAEAELAKATESENVWVRGYSIQALAKVKTETAAEAVAAQLYRARGEAGKALREMGPVAEAATIKYLKDRDHWVRGEVCAVLAEIGAEESLKALQAAAEGAAGLDRMALNKAIAAVEKRVEAGEKSPPPKRAKIAAAPAAVPGEPEYRKWRDTTGTYEVEATLVANQDQKVTLKRKDGKTVQVPITKLSKEDRDYLEKQAKPANPFE